MSRNLSHKAVLLLRLALLSVLVFTPVGILGYASANASTFGKSGAGLVLFVSLQRQAMS